MFFKITRPETIARTECQLFRDFCASAALLMEQFARFDRAGTLSYPALRDLLGEPTNRGPLWRLKDTAHVLFSDDDLPGQLLDCTLGSIFHETIKLMEATYQSHYYSSACEALVTRVGSSQAFFHLGQHLGQHLGEQNQDAQQPEQAGPTQPISGRPSLNYEGAANFGGQPDHLASAAKQLLAVLQAGGEDVRLGITRLQILLDISRPLVCVCFAGKTGNQMLLRFLEGRQALIEKVMGEYFVELKNALQAGQQRFIA